MISIRLRLRVFVFLLCHSILLVLPVTADATLTANAGPDNAVGYDVPVVLDGSASSDSGGARLTYLWQQTGGAVHLDMIGQDRVKPMIISAHVAGTYTFTLTVGNGTTTATDTMTLTISAPTGMARYVDNTIAATCSGSTYSIANRACNGSDGPGYKTIQEAANVVNPGDTVYIRGATYTHTTTSQLNSQPYVHITRTGTAIQPIRFQNYNGEFVELVGLGFSDADNNNDGYGDGPLNVGVREDIIWIDTGADYNQIVGLTVHEANHYGIYPCANYCYIENCRVYNSWFENIYFTNTSISTPVYGIVARWVESMWARHGSGITVGINGSTRADIDNCAAVDCLLYMNGYLPNGDRILPLAGDPEGGGNSDGYTISKNVFNNTPGTNYANNDYVIRNICYHNCDDNIDLSSQDSLIEGNYCLAAGPTAQNGIKVFSQVTGLIIRGNLMYWNEGTALQNRLALGGDVKVWQNTAVRNHLLGLSNIPGDPTDGTGSFFNNAGAFNPSDFASVTLPSGPYNANNWAKDGTGNAQHSGDPKLTNDNFGNPSLTNDMPRTVTDGVTNGTTTFASASANFTSDDLGKVINCTGVPANDRITKIIDSSHVIMASAATVSGSGLTATIGHYLSPTVTYFLALDSDPSHSILVKRQYILDQIRPAFTPTAASGLIDAGRVIDGYHCPTADDDPITPADPNDPRRHWNGAAPDIGAFEYDPNAGNAPEAPKNLVILN